MKRLFGIGGDKAPTKSLDEVSETMEARCGHVDAKVKAIDHELLDLKKQLATAKGPGAARLKQRAMMLLKQRKVLDQQYNQMQQQSFNVQQMAFQQQQIKSTVETVGVMKEGLKVMKKEMKPLRNIGAIEAMMDETSDLMMDANEVQECLGRSYDLGDEVTEEDLEAELAMYEEGMFEEVGEVSLAPAGGKKVPSYLQDDGELEGLGERRAAAQ